MAGVTKSRRGCLFYAALVGGILAALILLGTLVGLRVAKKMFNQFTDTQPTQMPEVPMSPAQIAAVQRRFEDFRDAVRAHRQTAPLTLSATDIDALLQADPDFASMKGKLYITSITNGQVEAKVSLPMEDAGLAMFKGRYLNATTTLNVALRGGVLRVLPQSVSAKGRPLPDIYMDTVRKQNLAKDVNRDPRASVALDRLESVDLKDGQLVIVPKQD